MIYYEGIEISDGTDVNKTSESKDCDVCDYWCFLNKAFNFQWYVCNGNHDILIMSTNLSNTSILNFSNDDYCCIISGVR